MYPIINFFYDHSTLLYLIILGLNLLQKYLKMNDSDDEKRNKLIIRSFLFSTAGLIFSFLYSTFPKTGGVSLEAFLALFLFLASLIIFPISIYYLIRCWR